MGRPKMPRSERKGKIAGVRLSPDERTMIDNAANKEGIELSKWMRKNLLQAAKNVLDLNGHDGIIRT